MQKDSILPRDFLRRMKSILGKEFETFLKSLDERPPVSIRLNPFKTRSTFSPLEQVPWCKTGRYLEERPSFTFDPLFHAGTYYVQEASSMFLEQVWEKINPDNERVRVLDMCASPGGKSTHLLSLMSPESLLVSNEVIPKRNKVLQENISKWGAANVVVTQNKPEDFSSLKSYFDIVLIDAPCSGEGLFRKDKDAVSEWSEKNVQMCSLRQRNILKSAVECLTPGGFLIYSTCTFESLENDENVKWLSGLGMVTRHLGIRMYGQEETECGYQFYPHRVKGEGFYVSVLAKNYELIHTDRYSIKNRSANTRRTGQKANFNFGFEYLNSNRFTLHSKHDFVFAIPEFLNEDYAFLERYLYIRGAGIFLGNAKGRDFIPSHDLALSIHIKPNLPALELDYNEAISYLRCEMPKIFTGLRGWVLVQYKGFNLGWIKVLEGRSNNYYPKERRILKQL